MNTFKEFTVHQKDHQSPVPTPPSYCHQYIQLERRSFGFTKINWFVMYEQLSVNKFQRCQSSEVM